MTTKFKGTEVHLNGHLPAIGQAMPNVRFVNSDLSEGDIAGLKGKVAVVTGASDGIGRAAGDRRRRFATRSSFEASPGLRPSAQLLRQPLLQGRMGLDRRPGTHRTPAHRIGRHAE